MGMVFMRWGVVLRELDSIRKIFMYDFHLSSFYRIELCRYGNMPLMSTLCSKISFLPNSWLTAVSISNVLCRICVSKENYAWLVSITRNIWAKSQSLQFSLQFNIVQMQVSSEYLFGEVNYAVWNLNSEL